MKSTQVDITADLTDERLQQAAARNYRSRSDSDVPRRVARYRAVAALAREGWQPIQPNTLPAAEGEAQKLAKQFCELAEALTRTGFYRMGNATTTDSWPSRLQRAAELLEQRTPAPVPAAAAPVRARERPWEQEGWCNELGRCWMGDPGHDEFIPSWRLCRPEDAPRMVWSLPHWAISVPTLDAS